MRYPRLNPIRGYDRGNRELPAHEGKGRIMNPLLIIVAIVAVVLLITGGLVQSLQFLLWVGIVLAILAVIMFLMRSMSGRKGA